MESNRLFISNSEKYIASYYFDVELYNNNGAEPIFLSTLGHLKNPHIVAFSGDDSEVLIKNNNNIYEIYDLSTLKKVFRYRGSAAYEENAFLIDDTIIVSTNDGSVYSINRKNKKRNLLCRFGDYTYSQLYHIGNESYVLMGYKQETNTTDFNYFDIIDNVVVKEKKHVSSFKMSPAGIYRYYGTDYFMSGNKLVSFNHSNNAADVITFDFDECDLSYKIEIEFMGEIINCPGIDNEKMHLVKILGFNNLLFVAYHEAVFILDLKTKMIKEKIKLSCSITDIAVSASKRQLWLASPHNTKCLDIRSVSNFR